MGHTRKTANLALVDPFAAAAAAAVNYSGQITIIHEPELRPLIFSLFLFGRPPPRQREDQWP